ncbi:HDOD domain-containing protein [Fontimonas sp. SYSU GA230001]|uniref:HDOD domain-containing protein n=1 Tax=Fontimonas sp. SYSU GA230001 TaxID=3142450 RepID=UPI0032B426B7
MKSLYLWLTVVDALNRDELTLPTLPDVALRVSRMCADPDVSAARLAREIATDPASAARLLRAANSAAYGGRPVADLQQAIARLGLPLTRTLVTRYALEQIHVARSPELVRILRASWVRSLEVAALAAVLARSRTPLNPATAMLAGLLREIGLLPLVGLVEARPELNDRPAELEAGLSNLHARVGVHLLRAWNFPDELAQVPVLSADLERQRDGPADYADVVCVAALQQQREHAGLLARLVPPPHSASHDRLGLPPRFNPARDARTATQLAAERVLLSA